MKGFVLGVIVGAAVALWFTQTRSRIDWDRQSGQMQERANQVLSESRRILAETRRELAALFQAGQHAVRETTGLGRPSGPAGEAPAPPAENPPPPSPPGL